MPDKKEIIVTLEDLSKDNAEGIARRSHLDEVMEVRFYATNGCLSGEEEGIKLFFEEVLQNRVHLRELKIEKSGTDPVPGLAQQVARVLESNPALTKLRLLNNEVKAKELAEALKKNEALTYLLLNQNNIGDDGAKKLAEALKENKVLTYLLLNQNNIGDDGAKELAEALKENKVLTCLILNGNKIGPEGAKDFADALIENKVLTYLLLFGNEIGPEGAKAFADALKKSTALKHLNLEKNEVKEEGAEAFAEALKENNVLTDLDLSNNNIGDRGAEVFADALSKNEVLTGLSLSANGIGNEGAKLLAGALKKNKSLIDLRLDGNKIGEEGAQAILEALKVNTKIIKITLDNNSVITSYESFLRLPRQTADGIKDETKKAIQRQIIWNKSIKSMKEGNSATYNAPSSEEYDSFGKKDILLKLSAINLLNTLVHTKKELKEKGASLFFKDGKVKKLENTPYVLEKTKDEYFSDEDAFYDAILPHLNTGEDETTKAELQKMTPEELNKKCMDAFKSLSSKIIEQASQEGDNSEVLAEHDAEKDGGTKTEESKDDSDSPDGDGDSGAEKTEEASESLEGEPDKEQSSSSKQSMFEASDPSFELVRLEWFEAKDNYTKPNSEEDEEMPEDSEYAEYSYSGYDLEKAPKELAGMPFHMITC